VVCRSIVVAQVPTASSNCLSAPARMQAMLSSSCQLVAPNVRQQLVGRLCRPQFARSLDFSGMCLSSGSTSARRFTNHRGRNPLTCCQEFRPLLVQCDMGCQMLLPMTARVPVQIAIRLKMTMRPQDLHKHRKRLEGFGDNVPRGHQETLLKCRPLLLDDDWYARKVAVNAIMKVAKPGDEVQLSLLYKHLQDSDIFVREAAVDAVAEIAKQADNMAISKVAMCLADEDCFVRARAVVALSRLGTKGDTETISLLDEMFEDGFVPVRKKAVEALIKLAKPGDPAVLERLRRCEHDTNQGVRSEAREGLEKLSAPQS